MLHHPVCRQFPIIPVLVFHVGEQWVADLVEITKRSNRGMPYLLTVINILSKYALLALLKSKTVKVVTAAFRGISRCAGGRRPLRLQRDKGKEFYSALFARLLARQGS